MAPGSLKVIEPYDNAKDESPFYCRRSTRALYPGIVISSLANAPDDIVKDVVRTLFTMSPFQGNEWAAGYDYTEVLRLMKDLKFGMYENLRDYSLGALLQRYKTELLILLTILLFLIGNELRVHHLVNKRTAELKGALEAKNAAEQEAVLGRKRLSHIERSGVISQMSNIIAHELKQPLGALLNYAAVLKLRLNDKMAEDPLTKTVVENMDAETRRISRIVDSVRKFAKKRAACTYRIRFSSNRRKGDPHFPSAGRGKNSSSLPNGCGHSAGFSRSSFLGTFNLMTWNPFAPSEIEGAK